VKDLPVRLIRLLIALLGITWAVLCAIGAQGLPT
jgi:hypothetical protein